jgi:hypothetical protein
MLLTELGFKFQVFQKPIVDRNNNIKYWKLKVLKKKGKSEEPLEKGQILHFLATKAEKLNKFLGKFQRFLVEIPADLLFLRSITEEINLKRINFLLTNPIKIIAGPNLLEFKRNLYFFIDNGLEVSVYCETLKENKLDIDWQIFKFVCLKPGGNCKFPHLCFENVDSEEIFKKLGNKGELFCGKYIGDYRFVTEITAITYLRRTIEKALKLLEKEFISVDLLEETIKTDPALTVEVLRYANSPLIAPISEIKDLKHAIVYLGTARLRNFLITFLINNLATVDEKLYDLALRFSAVGMLMEKKASPHYSEDESFMAGIIYELAKLAKVSPSEVYDLFSPPEKCRKILKDQKLRLVYKTITEREKEKMKKQLREIFELL